MKKNNKILLSVGIAVVGLVLIGVICYSFFFGTPRVKNCPKWTWGTEINPSGESVATRGEITTFAEDGCYTWWTNALALRHVGTKDQTYLSYVNEFGQMALASYNHETGAFAYTTLADFEKDDHNSAAITVLPNGKILAVYSRHSQDRIIRWRVSDNVEDITSFGKEQDIPSQGSVTYIQIHRINQAEYRIFYRYSMSSWSTRVYNWVEDTWSEEIVWLYEDQGKQYYLWTQEDKEEGKINVFMTGHPKSAPDQNIRYGYFDVDGGVYTTGGKKVGSLTKQLKDIPSPRDFDIVYEAKEAEHTRLYDVSFMGEKVAVLYGVGPKDGSNSKYYYAYYDSKKDKWVNNYICDSGKAAVTGNLYYGGVSFDKKDMTTIYVTRRNSEEKFCLEEWKTTDYGATWEVVEVIDTVNRRSETIMRPIIPYNTHDDIDVIYIKGLYPTYLTYDTDIVFYGDKQ